MLMWENNHLRLYAEKMLVENYSMQITQSWEEMQAEI